MTYVIVRYKVVECKEILHLVAFLFCSQVRGVHTAKICIMYYAKGKTSNAMSLVPLSKN